MGTHFRRLLWICVPGLLRMGFRGSRSAIWQKWRIRRKAALAAFPPEDLPPGPKFLI